MKEKKGEHPFGDAGQVILLVLFLVVWVGDSFFLRWATFPAAYVPLGIRLTVLGLVLILALVLIQSSHFIIAHDERPDHVVSTRAFRYVRHPLYLAALLTYFGMTASSFSLISLIVLIGIGFFYNYIASYEEKLLEAKFGEDYRAYQRRTGKWVPRIGPGS